MARGGGRFRTYCYCYYVLLWTSRHLSGFHSPFGFRNNPTRCRIHHDDWESTTSRIQPPPLSYQQERARSSSRTTTKLFGGYGVAANYSWTENQFEIEITVPIPKSVRAANVFFKATPTTIDLRYQNPNNNNSDTPRPQPQFIKKKKTTEKPENHDEPSSLSETVVLLDKNQKLKGRINLDGTYWVIADPEPQPAEYRNVVVTLEKHINPGRDDFDPIEYDWKSIYQIPDPTIIKVHYDPPEPLDMREYAASMGVDIDNLDMTKVDKTMFSSGLNLTRSSLDQLYKAGLLSEDTITQQADGTEYTVDEDGNPVPYSLMDSNKNLPAVTATIGTTNGVVLNNNNNNNNATTTTTSPTVIRQIRNMTRAAFALDSAVVSAKTTTKPPTDTTTTRDPIDGMTVERLKTILRSQGLPVSGNKAILQERLRKKVNALLQGRQDDVS